MGLLDDLTVDGKLPEGVSSWGCLLAPINGLDLGRLPFRFLLLQLIVVYVVTQCLHRGIFGRFGYPPITSQLIAGLLLSTDFSWKSSSSKAWIFRFIFPEESEVLWQAIGSLGCAFSLILVAIKMDISIIKKVGKMGVAFGILSAVIPFGVAYVTVDWLWRDEARFDAEERDSMFVCVLFIVQTHFQVIFSLVSDLELLSSELGRLALSSALISEVFSVSFGVGIHVVEMVFADGLWPLTLVAIVLFSVLILRPIMRWMIKQTPKERPVRDTYVFLVFLFVLVGGLITDWSGRTLVLGAFAVGLTVPAGPPLGSTLVDRFDTFISGVLEPFFVTTTVIASSAVSLDFKHPLVHYHFIALAIPIVVKVIVCVVCGLLYRMDLRDSVALGFLMNAKGLFDLSNGALARETTGLNRPSYQVFVFVLVLSNMLLPCIVKELYHPLRKYAGYQKRDIMHCRHRDELQIVACLHRLDNITGITNLLDICSPTADSPMCVNVLHLIKLAGQSLPIFISHDLQKKKASKHTHSEEVIWAFHRYKRQTRSRLSVHIFTSVSSAKSMHDDVCTLALNKLASLIVMPFHRRFNMDGTVDYDDRTQRALNLSVFQRAPCSVGVLISRSHRGRLTSSMSSLNSVAVAASSTALDFSYSVAVIFLGGADDREAVAFAIRMAESYNVKVDVIRPVVSGQPDAVDPDDYKTISYIRDNKECGRLFKFSEKAVTDGSETAKFLKTIVGDFDLILVGRRYWEDDCTVTSGLKEWSEIPEVGVLGDLLASRDIKSSTAVLVIQQQIRQWSWRNDGPVKD